LKVNSIPEFHKTDIFKNLPELERTNLLKEASARKLAKGEYLVHQGEIWPNVVFVISGRLRWAMLSTSGKEYVLFTIEANQVFWGHSIFDGLPMPASLSAANKSEVLLWNQETILRYLRRYPDVMWDITGVLTQIMRNAREIIYGLAFKPVAGRLATLLIQQCSDSSGNTIERNFTLYELATTIEDGILEITRASIKIHDMGALENAKED